MRREYAKMNTAQQQEEAHQMTTESKPSITIEYCVPCGYAPRATWTAQELLAPFADSISGLNLVPGDHGVFDIRVNDELVYSTKANNWVFPEIKDLVEAISKYTGEVEYKS
jgi:selenoprotein W-related protein